MTSITPYDVYQFFKWGVTRSFWGVADCFSGNTDLSRMIKETNTCAIEIKRQKAIFNRRIVQLIKSEEKELKLAYDCERNQSRLQAEYHADRVLRIRAEYLGLKLVVDKLTVVFIQVVDAYRQNALGVEIQRATKVLVRINDYTKSEDILSCLAEFQKQMNLSHETRKQIDTAVVEMDTTGQSNLEESKAKLLHPVKVDTVLSVLEEAQTRYNPVKKDVIDDTKSITYLPPPPVVVPLPQPTDESIENDLEERFKRLKDFVETKQEEEEPQ